ncbi:MAG: LCP family protein [Eggerthellaceae bacterium]
MLVLGGAGAAFAYYNVLGKPSRRRQRRAARRSRGYRFGERAVLHPLMGTDGSNDREASAEFAGDQFRSDSIILARIDPVDKKATLVSIHRDTLVDMGEYGQNKLNAAHAIGGAAHGENRIEVGGRAHFPLCRDQLTASKTLSMRWAASKWMFRWRSTTRMPAAIWMPGCRR